MEDRVDTAKHQHLFIDIDSRDVALRRVVQDDLFLVFDIDDDDQGLLGVLRVSLVFILELSGRFFVLRRLNNDSVDDELVTDGAVGHFVFPREGTLVDVFALPWSGLLHKFEKVDALLLIELLVIRVSLCVDRFGFGA